MSRRSTARTIASQVVLAPQSVLALRKAFERVLVRLSSGLLLKALLLVGLLVVAVTSAILGLTLEEVLAVAAMVLVVGWWGAALLERPIGLWRLGRRRFSVEGLPAAGDVLRAFGLDDATVVRLLRSAEAEGEVRVASFDQENRLLSQVGPIPYFRADLVAEADFIPRMRHRLDIVVTRGVVAIRKQYEGALSMQNEALALAALEGIAGVPRIVALDLRDRVMHQSFLLGENLGSLMTQHGAPVSLQHQLVTDRPAKGTWDDGFGLPGARSVALQAMGRVAPHGMVDALGTLLLQVHEAGVSPGDIKYGNVLLQDGRPVLCDFDWARVLPREGALLLGRRDDERDQFNYLFGGRVSTLAEMRREFAAVEAEEPIRLAARIDLGAGIRIGGRWRTTAGSGRWYSLRPFAAALRGRRVVDLGTVDPIVLVEMLQAGAGSVITAQDRPVAARFARTCHRAAELVRNRRFTLEVEEASSVAVGPQDLVTILPELVGGPQVTVEEVLARVPAAARSVLFQCELPRDVGALRAACAARGLRAERVVIAWYLDQATVLASRD